MKRIGTMTIIHAQGSGCEAIYNDIVSKEVKRINDENKALREQIKSTELHRNQLLAARLENLPTYKYKRHNRFINTIEIIWTMIWVTGVELGWWEYMEDDK